MSTETRTKPATVEPVVIGAGLAEEFAELLHLPLEQTRPLPQTLRGKPRRINRH